MGAGQKPRDIKERTFDFAVEIVHLCQDLDKKPGTTRTLGRQLLRSGTSIGANVEEAQAGQSWADFISKYSVALKEARETIYWLQLLKMSGVASSRSGADRSDYRFDYSECEERLVRGTTFYLLTFAL